MNEQYRRERILSRGAPREKKDKFESKETLNSSTAEFGDVIRERESGQRQLQESE